VDDTSHGPACVFVCINVYINKNMHIYVHINYIHILWLSNRLILIAGLTKQ